MYCDYCGHELPEGAAFCDKCGKPLSATQAETPEDDKATQAANAVAAAAAAMSANEFASATPEPPTSPFDQPAATTASFEQQPNQPFASYSQQSASASDQPGASASGQQGAPVYGQPASPAYGPQDSGRGTAPLVLGILSIAAATILGWTFIGPIAGIVLGILGIVQGGKVLRDEPANGKAKGGRITGIIGLILSILAFIVTIVLTVIIGAAVTQAVEDPDAFIDQLDQIAAMDDTGEAQKELDQLKQELEGLGVTSGSNSSSAASSSPDAAASSSQDAAAQGAQDSEPTDYTGGQAFDTWASECTSAGNQPTVYAITELKGWQFETLLQQLGYVWDPSVNTWFRDDGSYYGMVDEVGSPISDLQIAEGDKGGTGTGAAHILIVNGFSSAQDALGQMGQVVTEDVIYSDDNQSALAVVYGPSMTEYLVMVNQSPDDGKDSYALFVFPEETCNSGLFARYFGDDAGSSIAEVWKTITGGAVGDYAPSHT